MQCTRVADVTDIAALFNQKIRIAYTPLNAVRPRIPWLCNPLAAGQMQILDTPCTRLMHLRCRATSITLSPLPSGYRL